MTSADLITENKIDATLKIMSLLSMKRNINCTKIGHLIGSIVSIANKVDSFISHLAVSCTLVNTFILNYIM
jgi:hypothetical protein